MNPRPNHSQSLASRITKAASRQTYYTIRLLADRERAADAYRAYGYFRWVDDILDEEKETSVEKLKFVYRQQALLEACYRGEKLDALCDEEQILVDLIENDREENSGLQIYLRNMMGVMLFDAKRKGRIISQDELTEYSHLLATAVTEALYYFIGHTDPAPYHAARYLSVTAAHITHMLRDTLEDTVVGYFNIPQEYLRAHKIKPSDVECPAYREWVYDRVQLAYLYFRAGRYYIAQTTNLRRRLAGYAYTARFEWILHAIERDNYILRRDYPERKSLRAGLWMLGYVLTSTLTFQKNKAGHQSRLYHQWLH